MADQMRAARIHAAEDIRLESVGVRDPGPDEVVLQITAAGVCGTDASLFRYGPTIIPDAERTAKWPIVLGHEFAGRVIGRGSEVDGLEIGELVACGAGVSCGECAQCRAGRTNHCERYWTAGIHRDGGLGEFCVIPAAICEPTARHGVDGDAAGLAQPMSIALHAVRQGQLKKGDRALILGVGGIGAFATWAAIQMGAEVTICDRDPSRLAVAADLGVAATYEVGEEPLLDMLREAGPWDVVYEITGAEEPLLAAMDLVRPAGRVVAVGIQSKPRTLELARLTAAEMELVGTSAHVCGIDLPDALDLLGARAAGWADFAPTVFSLDDLLEQALPSIVSGAAPQVKVLVDPAAESSRPYAA